MQHVGLRLSASCERWDSGKLQLLVYTPVDYFYSQEQTPVIIFLHGASLCGKNLNKVRRYGPLDAIVRGAISMRWPSFHRIREEPGIEENHGYARLGEEDYPCDSNRVYVLGMSLGGYGTMDVCATYPDRIAAGMALCGGCSYKDVSGLGDLPFWIIHGTADRAVPVKQSKVVVDKLEGWQGYRLIYDWWKGANHGTPAVCLSEENLSVALLSAFRIKTDPWIKHQYYDERFGPLRAHMVRVWWMNVQNALSLLINSSMVAVQYPSVIKETGRLQWISWRESGEQFCYLLQPILINIIEGAMRCSCQYQYGFKKMKNCHFHRNISILSIFFVLLHHQLK